MRERTPWAVRCTDHGSVYLTEEEYDVQMDHPDSLWRCPLCMGLAEWDTDNYESFYIDDEDEDEDEGEVF